MTNTPSKDEKTPVGLRYEFSSPPSVQIPPPAPAPNLSKILAFAFWMRKQGYRPSTIQAAISTLKAIAKNHSLLIPYD